MTLIRDMNARVRGVADPRDVLHPKRFVLVKPDNPPRVALDLPPIGEALSVGIGFNVFRSKLHGAFEGVFGGDVRIALGFMEDQGIDVSFLEGEYAFAGAHTVVSAEHLYHALQPVCRRYEDVVGLAELWIAATINEFVDETWSVPAQSAFFHRVATLGVKRRARPSSARQFTRVIKTIEREHEQMRRLSKPIGASDMAMRAGRQVDHELDAFDAVALSAHLGALCTAAKGGRDSMMSEAVRALLKADYAHAIEMHEQALRTMSGAERLSLPAAVHHLAASTLYFSMAGREADGRKKEMLLGAYRHAVLAGEGEVINSTTIHGHVKRFAKRISVALDRVHPPVNRIAVDVPRRTAVSTVRPPLQSRLWK